MLRPAWHSFTLWKRCSLIQGSNLVYRPTADTCNSFTVYNGVSVWRWRVPLMTRNHNVRDASSRLSRCLCVTTQPWPLLYTGHHTNQDNSNYVYSHYTHHTKAFKILSILCPKDMEWASSAHYNSLMSFHRLKIMIYFYILYCQYVTKHIIETHSILTNYWVTIHKA